MLGFENSGYLNVPFNSSFIKHGTCGSKGRTLELSADQIQYKVTGDGPPLLMLHGWNRSGADLRPLAELVGSARTVYTLDLPGFGETPPPPEDGWDTSDYSELIVSFIQSKGLDKVSLLGHSFGGRVSLRIAAKYPEIVEGIILIDSHGLRPMRSFYQNMRVRLIKLAAKVVKTTDKLLGTTIFPDKFAVKFGSADYRNAGVLKNTFVKTISEDQESDVRNIKARALLLWGSEDRETPVVMGEKFHQLLSNSKLIILPGKGHSPFHGVGAHLCANYILQFLAEGSGA